MSDSSAQGPLAGIRVLNCTHVLVGPFATLLLADLGADVVKVEKPGRGDTTRGTPPYLHGFSHYFVAVNHSRRGLGIDMQMDAHDVPNGPVLDVLSLLNHPWVDERRLLRPVPAPDGGTVRVSRQPVVYGSEPPPVAPAAAAPELGQHTDADINLELPTVR